MCCLKTCSVITDHRALMREQMEREACSKHRAWENILNYQNPCEETCISVLKYKHTGHFQEYWTFWAAHQLVSIFPRSAWCFSKVSGVSPPGFKSRLPHVVAIRPRTLNWGWKEILQGAEDKTRRKPWEVFCTVLGESSGFNKTFFEY